LYTVKSGEGIVSELFSFERFGGEKKFALRPEFTPTLARMYAAKAGSLPKPTKWFWMQNCYRAERPQRGRLREFCQWNCDIIGDDSSQADAEVIACAVGMFESLGLGPRHLRVRISHRAVLGSILGRLGIDPEHTDAAFVLLDRRDRLDDAELEAMAFEFGITNIDFLNYLKRPRTRKGGDAMEGALAALPADLREEMPRLLAPVREVEAQLRETGMGDWCEVDLGLVRGLAYYTGMVFEVHEASGAERAIAGGGRYDKLIEMFGGPPTPAVGFGMGDVVLSLVLADKGLMPSDDEIAVKLGLSPDVFVFAAENRENPEITRAADGAVVSTISELRRAGLHARRSYKATRNIGKLLGDATRARARFALIVETGTTGQIKDLKSGEQTAVDLREVVGRVAEKR
jgi:histidyl-tRNA synthetase